MNENIKNSEQEQDGLGTLVEMLKSELKDAIELQEQQEREEFNSGREDALRTSLRYLDQVCLSSQSHSNEQLLPYERILAEHITEGLKEAAQDREGLTGEQEFVQFKKLIEGYFDVYGELMFGDLQGEAFLREIYRRIKDKNLWPSSSSQPNKQTLTDEEIEKMADKHWHDYEYRITPGGLYSSVYVDAFITGYKSKK